MMPWPTREYVYRGKEFVQTRPGRPHPSRDKVLDFIRSELRLGKSFPSTSQIANHMGWKQASSVRGVLSSLVGDGWLICDTQTRPFTYALREDA